jgi:hypothetical protein
VWAGIPEIPTLASLGVIVGILAVVTLTSLVARRRADAATRNASDAPAEEDAPDASRDEPVAS